MPIASAVVADFPRKFTNGSVFRRCNHCIQQLCIFNTFAASGRKLNIGSINLHSKVFYTILNTVKANQFLVRACRANRRLDSVAHSCKVNAYCLKEILFQVKCRSQKPRRLNILSLKYTFPAILCSAIQRQR